MYPPAVATKGVPNGIKGVVVLLSFGIGLAEVVVVDNAVVVTASAVVVVVVKSLVENVGLDGLVVVSCAPEVDQVVVVVVSI